MLARTMNSGVILLHAFPAVQLAVILGPFWAQMNNSSLDKRIGELGFKDP